MTAFHPEDRTRSSLDELLSACGWIVQSRDEMNRSAGVGVVVRDFASAAGPMDYALLSTAPSAGRSRQSKKTLTQPLDRERAIAFDKRLAALDRRIDPETRAGLARLAGGRALAELAGGLLSAIDPDRIEQEVLAAAHGRAATEAERRKRAAA